MRKMKRAFSLAVALALAVTVMLTGCQSTPAKTSSNSNTLPPVTLKWYFGGTWPQTDQAAVFAEVNKYLQKKINTTVNFVPTDWGTYPDKISVAIASNEEYDVCFTSSWINNYVANVSKGAFLPLDDMLKTDAPKTYAAVPTSFWDAAKVNGKIYAVVCQQISARCTAAIFPADDAQKYGLDIASVIPGDLSSLTPYFTKVHAGSPDEFIQFDFTAVAEYLGQDYLGGWDIPGAIDVSDPNMTVINQYESPAMRKLNTTLQQWNKAGFMAVAKNITSNPSDMVARKAHLCMATIAGTYKPGDQQYNEVANGFPVAEAPTNKLVLTTSGITATMQAISRTSKNPDRAMQMLEIFNNDPIAYNLLNYGIKGTHYDLDSAGFQIAGPSQAKYNPNVPWMFATNYIAYVSQGQPKDVWQQTKDANNNAIKSPALGFSFNADPVKDQIAKCTAVMTKFKRGLDLGMYSDAQYDGMVSELKVAGSADIVAEMQKQLNAWKAAK